MNRERVQFALLARKQRDLMMKLIQVHTRFVSISGQLLQTEEFDLLRALAMAVRPTLDVRTIGSVYWVFDSSSRGRKMLIIQCFTTDLYPEDDMMEVPLKKIPIPVLEEFDRQWDDISRKPWLPPRKLSSRPKRKTLRNVIEIPKRS